MFRSLRARYFLVVVCTATIPILLLGTIAGLRSARELEEQSLILQTELAMRVERDISAFVSARLTELRVLERTNVLIAMDQTEQLTLLGRLLAHDQVYEEVAIFAPDGLLEAFASRTGMAPREVDHWSEEPFLQTGYWDRASSFVGAIHYYPDVREPLLDIAVPILERLTGRVAGILYVHVRFKPIWDFFADLELPEGADVFLVNAEGDVLAHRSPSVVLSGTAIDLPVRSGRQTLSDGRRGIVVWQQLSLVGGLTRVVVTRPLETALASANSMIMTTFGFAALLLAAGSALALQQAKAIIRPVEALSAAARRISDGDLTAQIKVSGPEEINILGTTLKEMTDRLQQTFAQLERSEYIERQRANVTLESIGDAVITTDREGRVTYVNPVAERLTGWPRDEAQDRPLPEVFRTFHGATRAPVINPVDRCLASEAIVTLANDSILTSRNGTEFAISESAAPIREKDGGILGAVLVFRDVTHRKKLEAALRHGQKMEAIGQLTGGIAHDFNNLLQVIQGNAELLTCDSGSDATIVEPILRATERGAELTSRLLSFGRKQALRPVAIEVSSMVGGMLPLLDRALGEMIDVAIEIEPDTWRILADPGQLETALLNLALNARDAMPKGGRLVIGGRNATQSDFNEAYPGDLREAEFVALSVSDTGSGMPADALKRAAEPFFTTKGVGEGSGLGLSMVFGFVMQSGGHFEIASEVNVGTTVTLFLPRSREHTGCIPGSDGSKLAAAQGETILVIEDDADVRAQTRRSLESLGYRVVDVGNLTAAREILEHTEYVDLVLTDVVLASEQSGLDFAQELRTTHPAIPVAFMSGYSDEMPAIVDIADTEAVLLSKPFQRNELATALRTLLDRPASHGPIG